MSSASQLEANRKNAKKSSGPKTQAGKERSARNALKHGLSISVETSLDYAPQIDQLALMIAGQCADADILRAAREVAAAHLELKRLKIYEQELYANPKHRVKQLTARQSARHEARQDRQKIKIIQKTADVFVSPMDPAKKNEVIDILFRLMLQMNEIPKPPSLELGLAEVTKKLARLDRYRRRAFSRLRNAIRDLDALRLQPAVT